MANAMRQLKKVQDQVMLVAVTVSQKKIKRNTIIVSELVKQKIRYYFRKIQNYPKSEVHSFLSENTKR